MVRIDGRYRTCLEPQNGGNVNTFLRATVRLLGLSPSHLVSAEADSALSIWDPDTGEVRHTYVGCAHRRDEFTKFSVGRMAGMSANFSQTFMVSGIGKILMTKGWLVGFRRRLVAIRPAYDVLHLFMEQFCRL